MRRPRRASVVVVLAMTAGALGLALAAGDPQQLELDARIVVARHPAGTAGTGTVRLTNVGAQPFDVGRIRSECGAVRLAGGSGDMPFTLAPNGGNRALAVECPASLPPGLHRCQFTVHDLADAPVLDFVGACAAETLPLLTPSTASVSFAPVRVGQQSTPQLVVLQNTSPSVPVSLLQLQVDDDNFFVGAPCQNTAGCDARAGGVIPPGGSLAVEVSCRPGSVGNHTGQLFAIAGDGSFAPPVALACTGQSVNAPVLSVTPGSVALPGTVEVQGGLAAAVVHVTNTGRTGTLSIDDISIADDGVTGAAADWTPTFAGACTALPCTLAASQTLDLRLAFDPGGVGPRPARLVLNYTDPAIKQTTVTLAGAGRGATLAFAGLDRLPARVLDFGVLPLDKTVERTFALKNLGNRPTTAALAAMPAVPFTFPASVDVPPGPPVVVTPSCRAASPTSGVIERSLAIDAGADVATEPLALTLRCEVRDTPVAADPTYFDFGELARGSGTVMQTFQIVRVGAGAPIPLVGAALAEPAPHLTLGPLMPATTPATVTLAIDTTDEASLDNAIVVTPMGATPITIPLGGAIVTRSFATPNVVSLGTFCVGQPTSPSTIALETTGTGHVALEAPRLELSPSPFQLELLTPATYPAELDPALGSAAGPATRAEVLLTPLRSSTAGVVMDRLLWEPESTEDQTTVTATFVDDGGAIAPDTLDFGRVQIRLATASPKQVTLQNCDVVALELEAPSVPPPFVLDDNDFPSVLEPGQRATFEIAFRPTQLGPVEKQLVVRSRAGDEFVVTLRGTGITSDPDDNGDGDDRGTTSFYACSCSGGGSPLAGWPLLVVAVLLVRRRRTC